MDVVVVGYPTIGKKAEFSGAFIQLTVGRIALPWTVCRLWNLIACNDYHLMASLSIDIEYQHAEVEHMALVVSVTNDKLREDIKKLREELHWTKLYAKHSGNPACTFDPALEAKRIVQEVSTNPALRDDVIDGLKRRQSELVIELNHLNTEKKRK